jgi:hypothetical protein
VSTYPRTSAVLRGTAIVGAHPEDEPAMPLETGSLLKFDLTQWAIVGDRVADARAAAQA